LLNRVEDDEGERLDSLEHELANRWRYCADSHALATLLRSFRPLVKSIASERYAAHGLDDHQTWKDIFAFGRLGLIEAVNRYDGRGPLAAYAYWWILKRCEEFARFSKNVVLQPEPAEWKGRKEDKTPQTIPIGRLEEPRLVDWQLDERRTLKCLAIFRQLNPFENPWSIDYRPKPSRHVSYSTPIENDDNNLIPEEWVIGRFNARSIDVENEIDGANHFESDDVQAAAYESAAAEARALGVETLQLTLDARTLASLPRELKVIRVRFPWAIDVKNTPDREEELGEYQRGHKRYFPKKHTRLTIGEAFGIDRERVRQIEVCALEKIRASKLAAVCSREMFWGPQPFWNKARLTRLATNWEAPDLPSPPPDEPLIDDLVRLISLASPLVSEKY
jgi:RNA polymerase sigma factor (sigma-70 family)